MWILRGIAFVTSQRREHPRAGVADAASPRRRSASATSLYPVPMLVDARRDASCGAVYLTRTVMGRHVFAVGGNAEASRFSGLRLRRIKIGVFVLSGLTAGLAAFLGASFYGSASCGDATGYELYVIASAVVGGASLSGGKGSAVSAMLGAVLIVLIRQSIRTLHFDQNYEWIIIGCAIDHRGRARSGERAVRGAAAGAGGEAVSVHDQRASERSHDSRSDDGSR